MTTASRRHRAVVDSPLRRLVLEADEQGLHVLRWASDDAPPDDTALAANPVLVAARQQLCEYFGRRRRSFRLPLSPPPTPFQRRVRDALFAIPPGETVTYGRLAQRLESGPRAVARACASNPMPIIVPCHRVVGATSEGGYSGTGGLATKRFLLDLEGARPISGLGGRREPK